MSKTRNKLKLTGLLLTVVMIVSLLGAFSLTAGAAEAVSYVDYIWSEESKTLLSETKSIDTYTEITTTTTEMTSGWYVVNGQVTVAERMTATGEVRLILADGAHLNASLGITVNEGNSLYIYGQSSNESTMGKLTATTTSSDAAIGSLKFNHAGTIVINGGNINVSTSGYGAGIGSATYRGGYQITINAGVVTATSGWSAAAIGSGNNGGSGVRGTVHSICINGGVVNATVTANSGAAIGGGSLFDGGDITITGGTVTATSESYGAAIGGGSDGDGGNITITGGKVTAKNTNNSSSAGAGIGSGYYASGGNITITGGNVTAVGGYQCAGIGGRANAGNIIITGGVINSTGNVRAYGIGGGVAGKTGSIAILTSQVTASAGLGDIGFGEKPDGPCSSMLLEGGTVTVTGAFTLLMDYTLPEGYTLVISDGASLTIPAGVTFKLPGKYDLTNNGTINAAAGAVNCTAHKYVNGVCVCGLECKHEGGTATCTVKAVCTICGTSYGEFSLTNHSWENGICNYECNTTHTPHVWGDKNGICTVCGATCTHTGGTATCVAKAVCAHCGTIYGELGGHSFDDESKCAVCGTACTHKTFTDGKCPCGLTGGYCGAATNEGGEESVIWTYDEETGAFTVSGSGAMKDYKSYTDRPWNGIKENVTSLTIAEGVTRIGKVAFHNFFEITAVTVPASVESIGYGAFVNCNSVQSVTFAEGSKLRTIEYYAFQLCNMTQITIPAGVEVFYGDTMFWGCYALTDIFVAEGSTTLQSMDGVLYSADGSTLLYYPLGKPAESFTTPAGVTTIGEGAFEQNVKLKSITLSEGVTSIGEFAFGGCQALETLNLPNSLINIDLGAFAACYNLTTVVIPEGMTTLGEEAFYSCKSLTTVTIPASVTTIGKKAFYECDALTTVNVPCTWDGSLYTFGDGVTLKDSHTEKATYTLTADGTHSASYPCCGTIVTEDHTPTYSASGNVITATCSAKCGYVCTATVSAANTTYDGTEQKTATVTYSEGWTGGEPTVSYVNNVNAGTATASITLGEATASVEFTIAKADSTLTAPNAITDLVYNGSNQALVSAGSSTTGTVQYKLNDGEWSTNVPTATEAGEYTVYYKLVGDKNHKDVAEASVKVAILSKSAANAEVSFNGNLVYDGNAKTPEITVVFEQKELVPMKDYIVSCSNNVNAGTAAIEITFIGNYEGKVVKSFTIAPRQLVIFWENTNMIYNGNRQTPTAKLFGVIPGDEVGYTVSGWGKFGGTYTAKVEKLTNPNYVLPADATCRFTIDANPIEVAIDVAVDIYDIIPDSAKEAVANAAINAAENALNDAKNAATECINSAVDQLTDCVSTKAQEAANAAKSLADALCELWQNLCNRVSCFF